MPMTAARARRVAGYIELSLPSLDSHTTRILSGSSRAYRPKVTGGLPAAINRMTAYASDSGGTNSLDGLEGKCI